MKKAKFKETEIGKIPEDWDIKKLKNITTKIGSGATPRGGKNSYYSEGISLIRSQNVFNKGFVENGLAFIDENQAKDLSNVIVEENDLLLNITGASVGRSCMVHETILPARVNQHVVIIRANQSLVNSYFLRFVLISSFMQNHMQSLASAGATRQALTKEMIESFQIPLPVIGEQKAIAKVLSALDSKIELNQQMNKTLEAIGQALFKRWFVDFEFPNDEGKPYKSSGGKMIDSELGEIPNDWEIAQIQNLCKIFSNGGTPKRMESTFWDGDINWYKTGELWVKLNI